MSLYDINWGSIGKIYTTLTPHQLGSIGKIYMTLTRHQLGIDWEDLHDIYTTLIRHCLGDQLGRFT